MTKTITILGSTGSIGRQTLSVADELGLSVAALTAERNVELLETQCRRYRPELAVLMEESAAKAEEYKTRIESAAKDELLRHGCDDSVTASVEDCRFPTKNYGDISLPGGVYTALNIRIGKASGRNWWCVMYPPLCINNGNAVISEESRSKLKAVLSPDEYRLITSGEQPDIKIKFKIAEVLGRCFR